MNNILDEYTPFEKITKYKLKFKTKPWITTALQKPISIKNKILKIVLKRKTQCALGYRPPPPQPP